MFRYLMSGDLLPMPADPQLVGIVFTDIEGYTRYLTLTECNGKGQTQISGSARTWYYSLINCSVSLNVPQLKIMEYAPASRPFVLMEALVVPAFSCNVLTVVPFASATRMTDPGNPSRSLKNS